MTNVHFIQSKLFNLNKVLKFWFNECKPQQWFVKDKKFDLIINKRFYNLVCEALENKLDDWTIIQDGSVALILLLDQFTRNIFRGSPKSFSGNEKALNIKFKFLKSWRIEDLHTRKIQFQLMPMMHSDDIKIQEKSLPLFKKYTNDSVYKFAIIHRNIIYLFERFPHRNKILNRVSTNEEIEFLKLKGSSF